MILADRPSGIRNWRLRSLGIDPFKYKRGVQRSGTTPWNNLNANVRWQSEQMTTTVSRINFEECEALFKNESQSFFFRL